jgi:SAM-dependent methyltransferase
VALGIDDRRLMAPEAVYDSIGACYAPLRRPDARLTGALRASLGPAESIVNVGAGAGSYEPPDCVVVAVEPSVTMIRQRPAEAGPAVRGVAEALPLSDGCVDAALAVFTIHHWADVANGLNELVRVARRRIVLLTMDPLHLEQHWVIAEYAPEIMDTHVAEFPSIAWLLGALPSARAVEWEVPADCSDLFMAALWARPEAYLHPAIRSATSVWHQLSAAVADRAVERLGADLEAGRWDARHGDLRRTAALDVGVRIVIADLTATGDTRDRAPRR